MSPRSNPTVSDTVTQQKLVTQGLEEFLGAIHGISNLNFSSHVSVGHYPRWHHLFLNKKSTDILALVLENIRSSIVFIIQEFEKR